MAVMYAPKAQGLRALYWRSEILQLMFWLRGEGFGDEADPTLLERFLGVDSCIGVEHLERLVEEGSLDRAGDRYKLTETGAREGAREFAASFECPRGSCCQKWPEASSSCGRSTPLSIRCPVMG